MKDYKNFVMVSDMDAFLIRKWNGCIIRQSECNRKFWSLRDDMGMLLPLIKRPLALCYLFHRSDIHIVARIEQRSYLLSINLKF